jgi:hypothetical protein
VALILRIGINHVHEGDAAHPTMEHLLTQTEALQQRST